MFNRGMINHFSGKKVSYGIVVGMREYCLAISYQHTPEELYWIPIDVFNECGTQDKFFTRDGEFCDVYWQGFL